jgi:hypothetical protein
MNARTQFRGGDRLVMRSGKALFEEVQRPPVVMAIRPHAFIIAFSCTVDTALASRGGRYRGSAVLW